MKTKDIILIAVAVVAILLFAAFMFTDHRKAELNKLMREDLYNDSVLMFDQQELRYQDSVMGIDLENQGRRLNYLERMHRHRKDTSIKQ